MDLFSSNAEELFNVDGNLIKYSHPLWQQLSKNLGGQMSAHSMYLSVKQDRHSCQTRLRKIVGKPMTQSEPIYSDNEKKEKSSTDTDDGSDGIPENKQFFDFDIPYRDYVDVVYGKKNKKNTQF